MERRTFLRGLLIGTAEGTAIIKLATASEMNALQLNQPALIGQPPLMRMEDAAFAMMSGDPIYVRRNSVYLPIGIVTELRPRQSVHEFHGWTGEAQYIPGLRSVTILFEGDQ